MEAQGSAVPRRSRKRSARARAAGDDEVAADLDTAGAAQQGGLLRRKRKGSAKGKSSAGVDPGVPEASLEGGPSAGGEPSDGAASLPKKRKSRVRKAPKSEAQELLSGEAGGDEAEECTGMLLADLVADPSSLGGPLPLGARAKGRKGKRKARAPAEAELEEEPAWSDEDPGEAQAGSERLLSAVSRLGGADAQAPDKARAGRRAAEVRPESEFHTGSPGETVTVDDLLAPLAEVPSFGDVRRQLEGLAKTEPVPEPASEVKRSREERRVEDEKASKDADKWRGQLDRMKNSGQVVLGDDGALRQDSISTLVSRCEPKDDFERELEEATRAAGATEKDLNAGKSLPLNPKIRDEQQMQKVAKLKAMLFREQQSSKRVKKIKSKAYHRIQRRAETRERETLLERLDTENPELAKALRVEYEKKHAEKRMLRQRNARRKWAQTMQRFAKGDKTAQREVSKQAQEAHDEERGLRRAIQGQRPDQSDDSEAAGLSGSDSEGEGPGRRSVARSTISKAKKLTLQEIKGLERGEEELPTTGILGMNFMRKAIQERRESAKREAQDVLKELQGLDKRLDDAEEGGSDEDEEAGGGAAAGEAGASSAGSAAQGEKAKKRQFTAEELAAARKEVDAMLEQEGNVVECSVSGPLTVRGVAAAAAAPKARAAAKTPGAPRPAAAAAAAEVENPWLDVGPESATASTANTALPARGAGLGAAPTAGPPEASAQQAAGNEASERPTPGKRKKKAAKPQESRTEATDRQQATAANGEEGAGSWGVEDVLSVLNADSEAAQEQRDLVRTAFVEGTQAEDFDEEQEELRKKKEDKDQGPEELAGWGHWTGEGAPVRKPKREAPAPKAKAAEKLARVQFHEGGDGEKAAKYFVDRLPHGMTSPEQYNAQMRMPLGPEWNGLTTHMQRIKPKTFVKVGGIVPPLQYVKHLPKKEFDSALHTWSSAKQPKRLKARF